MSVQYNVLLRNAQLDLIESMAGTSPKLVIYSGAKPVNVAAADPSGVLATITLPSDWASAASAGVKQLLGSITGVGSAAGNAASWRLKDNAATTVWLQGTCSATGGGGDIELDNVNIAIGQTININSGSGTGVTAGNA
jgi:hypothetical protein